MPDSGCRSCFGVGMQLDLFSVPPAQASQKVLREEHHFGIMDRRSGLGIRNYYSERIGGERLAAYKAGYRGEEQEAG